MEFGHVYGTRRAVVMPVEIGVVLHNPEEDQLRYLGETFRYDIDLELWKNVTDARGKTLGVTATVANLGRGEYRKPFLRGYRLPGYRVQAAREVARSAFADLGLFMQRLCDDADISTLAFFADGMEMMAFEQAGVETEKFDRIGLQREVKRLLGMKDHLSLDRVSTIIGFSTARSQIQSAHFSYPVPPNLRRYIKPHRALGDAARIFLLSREVAEASEAFEARAHAFLQPEPAPARGEGVPRRPLLQEPERDPNPLPRGERVSRPDGPKPRTRSFLRPFSSG